MPLKQQIPLDIINEIRGRLPPKSLVRFRCISKAWIDITNDIDLARKQLRRSGKTLDDRQLLCLINFHREEDLAVTSKISKQTIEINIPFNSISRATYCNGWHCFSTAIGSFDGHILMHNPLRQETFVLPQVSRFTTKGAGHDWYGLGFDARNSLFKLTCLFDAGSTTEFYILRQKHFWEKLELPGSLRNCHHQYRRTVFLNGSIHYVVQEGISSDISIILAFDVEKEQFRHIDLPRGFGFSHVLMDLGGVLAAYMSENHTNSKELHVLKDYAKGEWDAPLRIPVSQRNIKGKMGLNIGNDHGVMGSWGTQVLFRLRIVLNGHNPPFDLNSTYQYHAYDIQTGKFTSIDLSQLPSSASSTRYNEVYGHQLSLVPLNM